MIGRNPYPIVILLAIAQHVIWAICLMVDQTALGVTGMFGIKHLPFATPFPVIFVLFAIASMAMFAIWQANWLVRVLFMMPQQFVLCVSAGGAIISMWSGVFADGTVRSSAFLIVDQIPGVLLAAGHTVAVFQAAAVRNT